MRRQKQRPTPDDPELIAHLPDALALEHRPLPRPARRLAYLCISMLVAFFLWATVSHVDRIVVAHGKLVSSEPLLVVQPLESAIVREILVRAGDRVKKGDILAHLDPTFATADASALATQKASLDAEIDRLNAERTDTPFDPGSDPQREMQASLLRERRAERQSGLQNLDEAIAKVKASLGTNAGRQSSLEAQIVLLKSLEDIRSKLYEKKHVSLVELLEAQNATLSAGSELKQLQGEAIELQHQLAADEAKRAAFVSEHRRDMEEDLVAAIRRRDALTEELTKARRKAELVVLAAPADGIVMEVADRSIGSVLQPAEPLMTLVPANSALKAEVEIDAADIGLVAPGRDVRVKLDAFPFQRYGTLDGVLEIVTPDAFHRSPPEVGAYFMGRINLRSLKLDGLAESVRFTPGMTLIAEIHAGEQRLISYLSYPVIRILDESLREPN